MIIDLSILSLLICHHSMTVPLDSLIMSVFFDRLINIKQTKSNDISMSFMIFDFYFLLTSTKENYREKRKINGQHSCLIIILLNSWRVKCISHHCIICPRVRCYISNRCCSTILWKVWFRFFRWFTHDIMKIFQKEKWYNHIYYKTKYWTKSINWPREFFFCLILIR